jgi:hypothetical protein
VIDANLLLTDLRRELALLIEDVGGQVRGDAGVRARLETEWKSAFDNNRTGRTFEAWMEDRVTQVAVGWLLACVFVRFCEDNRLITEPLIGGPEDRGAAARVAQQRYFSERPHDSDREYLCSVFRRAAELPSMAGLLAEGESSLWLVDPPADACTHMLALFRATHGDTGTLVHDFSDANLDTRFLGDLYQDLSTQARDDYALLQTPHFVEEFILDRTLTPAIGTFGLARTTLIDPTCGSGHFLLGAFDRLWQEWKTVEPATSERDLAQRVLTAVTGVDLNPFAAAIARFRLLVAALKVCGINDLRGAPDFTIDVAVGDSLLWGVRPGQFEGMEDSVTTMAPERQFFYRTEHAERLKLIFDRQYAAVVGNPPYIVCRDPALNQQYRERYPKSCHRQYSLAAPFMERFFELAISPDRMSRPAGFIGMITANSFMKREFGKKLIEQCIPMWDLTHVIDTSGAYIPGHGTPTVILLGRHQGPVRPTIRTVMGIRGEPSTPADPATGLVWSAIVSQVDEPGSESEYISVADTDRSRFASHPWSIGGGGAAELKQVLDRSALTQLAARIEVISTIAITREDDAYFGWHQTWRRRGLRDELTIVSGTGDRVRDWATSPNVVAIFPYNPHLEASLGARSELLPVLWPYKQHLLQRKELGGYQVDVGKTWFEWNRFLKHRYIEPLSIVFAFVATHNHFVLDRGGKVFNRSAPVIKLPSGASVDDHLALLGPLNSSVACFWMQQVFHNKGASVDARGARQTTVAWENFYEHDATKLQQFPLPPGQPPVGIARTLDGLATKLVTRQPSAICAEDVPTRDRLDMAFIEAERIFAEMVAWQEELDWLCLHLYGLTDELLTVPDGETPPPLALGERAFEIVLARKLAVGEIETAWFTRHRSTPITEVPGNWPFWYQDLVQRRIDLIERDRDVALVERPEHKRRWAREPRNKLESDALRTWLLDRLEDRSLWFDGAGDNERAVSRSVAQLADRVARDPEFMSVARVWKGVVEIDPTALVAELVADEHVPAQSAARYKSSGLAKRRQWERTWDLQRIEDCGQPLPDDLDRIPVPPRYTQTDFQKTSYWRQRGKLDVPKERFTSVADAERDNDTTAVMAWAGFDHAQLAQAVGTLLVERRQTDGWNPDQCWPLVVALAEQLPWLEQWHSEIDPRWGASPAQLYRGIVEQYAFAAGRTLADIGDWQPRIPTRGRRQAATKDETS